MRSCFTLPAGVAFADFITEGHRETWPIRSKRFRTWLRRCYYHASGSAPSAAAIRSVLDLFERRAQFDGPERCRAARAHPCRCPVGSQTMLTVLARATFPFAQWGRAHGMPPRPSARQSADRQAPSVMAVPREGTQLQAIMDITAGRRTISALASIQACRSSDGATDEVRANHQSQDRQGPRPRSPAHTACPRRQRDRMSAPG